MISGQYHPAIRQHTINTQHLNNCASSSSARVLFHDWICLLWKMEGLDGLDLNLPSGYSDPYLGR